MEILANSLLFLSAILLLVDCSPQDLFPMHRRRKRAIESLRLNGNLLRRLDAVTKVVAESADMQIVEDEASFKVLAEFIKQRSLEAAHIDWNRSIGIGYAVQSLPVGRVGLPVFKPVYVALIQDSYPEKIDLHPVGQLNDLYAWLERQRSDSTARLAISLLVLGFLLQLICSLSRM